MSGVKLHKARNGIVVSYHPIIEGNVNLLCADRPLDAEDFYWMRRARAIILPQGCRPDLFFTAIKFCPNVFPNYRCRFLYPTKAGQVRLFRALGIPHPLSMIFGSVTSCPSWFWRRISYPVVIKSVWGGEGANVYLATNQRDVALILKRLREMERAGWAGFIVQDYIQSGDRDLRVVIIGEDVSCYWRVRSSRDEFRHNVHLGGKIEPPRSNGEVFYARALVDYLIKKTGINLAGLDIIFSQRERYKKYPYMLEINYFFGRRSLGGNERFYELLKKAVHQWLTNVT